VERKTPQRWESPTFARTTDNPPYANYPTLKPSALTTTTSLLLNSTLSQTQRGNLFLHKKCYYGETLQGMPWMQTNIDLSFPEIKRTVELDAKQLP
jgi:hypothetical protein